MPRISHVGTTLIGLTAAAVVGLGLAGASTAAAAEPTPAGVTPIPAAVNADPLGPFEQLSSCLRRGNQGVEDGEFADYTCEGGNGNWWVHPIYS